MNAQVPEHLVKYVSEQKYSQYTFEDQAVWRFIMRQLFSFLKEHAHPAYTTGLSKTGLSIEEIPKIDEMNLRLKDYGWQAVPVSGFIPPAAFMSFQANRILPIACEMRSMDHILYTPAPDIVHEAAGHAPILIDPKFTEYLSAYGEVASKAIISSEDLSLYEAIRDLSDIKEHPNSSPEEITQAEKRLEKVSSEISYISEAQYLGRMNWWTAEYGLIGPLESPKIYGAGLLSSIDESRRSLNDPKHIKFDLDCLDYSYDITEQQPQLFVAEDFESLTRSLESISEKMAFTQGGKKGLEKALQAKSVCTVILEDQTSISGVVTSFELDEQEGLELIQFQSPCLVNDSDLLNEDSSFEFEVPKKVISVYGGPSSFKNYPVFEDFQAKQIQRADYVKTAQEDLLEEIRFFRSNEKFKSFASLEKRFFSTCPEHWLAGLEIFEVTQSEELKAHLLNLKNNAKTENTKTCIELGLSLASHEH